jgi:hypothetical protein
LRDRQDSLSTRQPVHPPDPHAPLFQLTFEIDNVIATNPNQQRLDETAFHHDRIIVPSDEGLASNVLLLFKRPPGMSNDPAHQRHENDKFLIAEITDGDSLLIRLCLDHIPFSTKG